MSKFFVGQRVKVVSTENGAENVIGSEGVVNEIGCEWCSSLSPVIYSDDGVGVTINGNSTWAFHPWQLEPILPEGSAPSEYSFSELMDSLRETVK